MGRTRANLQHKHFGKLAVICIGKTIVGSTGVRYTTWYCECECGKFVTVKTNLLQRGRYQCCESCKDIAKAKTHDYNYGKYKTHLKLDGAPVCNAQGMFHNNLKMVEGDDYNCGNCRAIMNGTGRHRHPDNKGCKDVQKLCMSGTYGTIGPNPCSQAYQEIKKS